MGDADRGCGYSIPQRLATRGPDPPSHRDFFSRSRFLGRSLDWARSISSAQQKKVRSSRYLLEGPIRRIRVGILGYFFDEIAGEQFGLKKCREIR